MEKKNKKQQQQKPDHKIVDSVHLEGFTQRETITILNNIILNVL